MKSPADSVDSLWHLRRYVVLDTSEYAINQCRAAFAIKNLFRRAAAQKCQWCNEPVSSLFFVTEDSYRVRRERLQTAGASCGLFRFGYCGANLRLVTRLADLRAGFTALIFGPAWRR